MTTATVTTNGFQGIPQVPAQVPAQRDTNPPITGGANLPPLNPTPGFNPPAGTQVVTSQTIPALQPPVQVPAQPQPAQPQPAQPAPQAAAPELVELSGVPTSNLRDFDIGEIDDPVIKSTANILLASSPNIDLDRALAKAIQYGQPDLIDVAYLKEKGGTNADNLITIAKSLVTQIANVAEANTKAVYALANGQENWETAVTAFNQFADPTQRKTISDLLDSGKPQFVQYAAQTVLAFSRQSGAVPFTGQQIQTGQASVAASQGLSKAQFQAELAKLNRNAPDYAEQSNILLGRRQLGKNIGL